jgi:hypothetical protein
MSNISIATLSTGGMTPVITNLPVNFSYKPATPARRMSIVPTSGNLVVRESPVNVPADSLIPFSISAMCKSDYETLFALYNIFPAPEYTFTGYWGDVFVVTFYTLDPPTVKNRIYSVNGAFRVVSVTHWSDPTINN